MEPNNHGDRESAADGVLTVPVHHLYVWYCPVCGRQNIRKEEWTDDTCEVCGKPVRMDNDAEH